MIDRTVLNSVCEQLYRRFPQVKGCAPRVQSRADGQYLVVIHGSARTADGCTLAATVRAVVSPAGKIIKVTTSKS